MNNIERTWAPGMVREHQELTRFGSVWVNNSGVKTTSHRENQTWQKDQMSPK